MTIAEATEVSQCLRPTYRKGCPADLALVASDGERAKVLDHIGPALDYWMEHHGELEGDFDGIAAGIWLVECGIETYGGGYYEDYDERLVLGEPRKLTAEEWALYREEECAWDPSLWLEPEKPSGSESELF